MQARLIGNDFLEHLLMVLLSQQKSAPLNLSMLHLHFTHTLILFLLAPLAYKINHSRRYLLHEISTIPWCGPYVISQSLILLKFMHLLITKSTRTLDQLSVRSSSFNGAGSTKFQNTNFFIIFHSCLGCEIHLIRRYSPSKILTVQLCGSYKILQPRHVLSSLHVAVVKSISTVDAQPP